jgi:multiple sugar transport system permease protein
MSASPSRAEADTGGRFWGGLTVRQKQVFWAWTFLAVPILFYALIRFYPTAEAFYLSTTNWNLLSKPEFVGLENFARLWADPVFWKVCRNTVLYLAIGTPVSLLLAFTIAYHLDRVRFMHGFIRALYFCRS